MLHHFVQRMTIQTKRITHLLVFDPQFLRYLKGRCFSKLRRLYCMSLSPCLYGFRKGYNAQHALLRLENKLNICLDKKENIGIFMMDLRGLTAFPTKF